MAENQEVVKTEREIPVFTVLKNNCILKNIYLLDKTPSISSSTVGAYLNQESEVEETLVVGRHPDCTIKLDHPSISRFHLRIHSIPSSRSLSVTDLSSVHGTWVSGKKVDPGVRIKLNEGDILQLGGSSRVYRLHWVPLSRAYDMEDPFVPQLDTADVIEEEMEEATHKDVDSSIRSDHIQNLGDDLEGLELLFSDANSCLSTRSMRPLMPLISEEFYHSSCSEKETENKKSPGICQETAIPSIHSFLSNNENSTSEHTLSSPASTIPPQKESMETSVMKSGKRSNMNIWSRRGKTEIVQIETGINREKSAELGSQSRTLVYEELNNESIPNNHYASPDHYEQEELLCTPDKENCSAISLLALNSDSILTTPISNLNMEDEIFSPHKEKTPDTRLLRSMNNMKKFEEVKQPNSYIPSLDLEDEAFTPDKENMTPDTRLLKSMKKFNEVKHPNSYRSSHLNRATGRNSDHEKEVLLPCLDTETKRSRVLKQQKSTNSGTKNSPNLKKEPIVSKARPDRKPFRPLSVKSSSGNKANSKPHLGEVTGRFICCPEFENVVHLHNKNAREENKQWTIVVDTGCVLNPKSRKELQLLQGLKGTNLIVPRIVIRELDCMLRRGSLFRSTSQVSTALQWIENCMANSKGWIHVQSSAEESRMVPPTPPPASSPQWLCGDKTTFSIPFSPYSSQEIATPTAEDCILECALFFKRLGNDGGLVLLSNDVTLKIKAMAEGLICETVEGFRRSLVNPFSDRFLYSDSLPRGLTWSCIDDAVLKEMYYPSPSRKLNNSGEGAKGLKLVLLHNSSFTQIKPVS